MKVYFITRFSIYDPAKKSWKTSRLPEEEYKKKLFSTDRLDIKFTVFEKMTLPSILKQQNKNYEWLIMSSIYLPIIYQEKLNKLVADHKQIKVFYINDWIEFNNIMESYPFEKNYATVRIDDDDGLSENYVDLLQQYKNKDGCVITFPYGHNYKIENNKIIIKNKEKYYPIIALGLCAINRNIHSYGDHSYIKKKYTVIQNNTKNMYYLFCSEYCDSKRSF